MTLQVTISVSVCDEEKCSYKDPSGDARVELYCLDTGEIESTTNSIAAALVKVASLKYKADVMEKEKQEKE